MQRGRISIVRLNSGQCGPDSSLIVAQGREQMGAVRMMRGRSRARVSSCRPSGAREQAVPLFPRPCPGLISPAPLGRTMGKDWAYAPLGNRGPASANKEMEDRRGSGKRGSEPRAGACRLHPGAVQSQTPGPVRRLPRTASPPASRRRSSLLAAFLTSLSRPDVAHASGVKPRTMSNRAASSLIWEPATGVNGTVTDAWACGSPMRR
jgi:hypothetical protein